MPLMCDVAYQRQKSSLHFGGFKVQAAFLGCRVGIYVLAISGCLGHRTRGQRVPTLRLLKTGFYEAQIEDRPRLAGGWFEGLWVVGGAQACMRV